MHISSAPVRTRYASFPHRDMMIPEIKPPMGVAKLGIARRAPVFVADSRRDTWNSRGSVKRNYSATWVSTEKGQSRIKYLIYLPHKQPPPHRRSRPASIWAATLSASWAESMEPLMSWLQQPGTARGEQCSRQGTVLPIYCSKGDRCHPDSAR